MYAAGSHPVGKIGNSQPAGPDPGSKIDAVHLEWSDFRITQCRVEHRASLGIVDCVTVEHPVPQLENLPFMHNFQQHPQRTPVERCLGVIQKQTICLKPERGSTVTVIGKQPGHVPGFGP